MNFHEADGNLRSVISRRDQLLLEPGGKERVSPFCIVWLPIGCHIALPVVLRKVGIEISLLLAGKRQVRPSSITFGAGLVAKWLPYSLPVGLNEVEISFHKRPFALGSRGEGVPPVAQMISVLAAILGD